MSHLAVFVRPLLFLSVLTPIVASAQQGAPAGSVAGTITFGDSRKPARFVKVTLTPVHSDVKKSLKGVSDKDAEANPMAALGALMGAITMLSTQTDIDGRYQLTGVAPGDYYVLATAPGYVSPSMEDLKSGDQNLNGTIRVHVEASQTATGDEALQRGATITGVVSYEDGSPVTGATVTVAHPKQSNGVAPPKKPGERDEDDIGRGMMLAMNGGIKIATTDDRGRYRIAGLAPGEYRVCATVSLSNNLAMRGGVMNLNAMKGAASRKVFAPDTVHEASGAIINAKAGEEADGTDILVNLRGSHSVSGRVSSAVDHHALNSGDVTLVDTTDSAVTYTGSAGQDGTFTVLYVPAGSYTLKVADAADTEAAPKKRPTGLLNFQQDKVLKSYDDASQSQIVTDTDVIGVQVELKESAKVKQQPDIGGILGGLAAPPPPPPHPGKPE